MLKWVAKYTWAAVNIYERPHQVFVWKTLLMFLIDFIFTFNLCFTKQISLFGTETLFSLSR